MRILILRPIAVPGIPELEVLSPARRGPSLPPCEEWSRARAYDDGDGRSGGSDPRGIPTDSSKEGDGPVFMTSACAWCPKEAGPPKKGVVR